MGTTPRRSGLVILSKPKDLGTSLQSHMFFVVKTAAQGDSADFCAQNPRKKRKTLYLALYLAGLLLPCSQFVPWVMQHGLNLPLFARELFATRIAAFFGMDVIVSAVSRLCLEELRWGQPLLAVRSSAARQVLTPQPARYSCHWHERQPKAAVPP